MKFWKTEAVEAAADKTSPAAIDAGRAQRLLERASALGSSGDMGAAILATRQALALAPGNVEAHLLHAGLLERHRDFGGARATYARSVELAPERADARANLARLDTYLEKSQGAARQFHFDDDELFDSNETAPAKHEDGQSGVAPAKSESDGAQIAESTPAVAPVLATPAAPQSATPSSQSPEGDGARAKLDESMLPDLEVRLPPSRTATATPVSVSQAPDAAGENGKKAPAQSAFMAGADAVAAAAREQTAPAATPTAQAATPAAPKDERRKHNVPVASERRRSPAKIAAKPLAASVAAASVAAAPAQTARAQTPVAAPLNPSNVSAPNPFGATASRAASAPRAPLALDIPAAPAAPLWQQVISRPSFYARTLPLVGAALLSLGFLSWARGRAVSQGRGARSHRVGERQRDR